MLKKEERKNEIIKKSLGEMHLNGFNGTSVKDITDAAGIPKGSFYNYFKDKEQYAVDAINYYYNVMSKDKRKILLDKKLEPLDRIKGFFQKNIEQLKESEFTCGCFVGNLSEEMGDVSPIISKVACDFHNSIIESIYNNLKEAENKGELNAPGDLKILAGFIVSSWQGSLVRMKTTKSIVALDEFNLILTSRLLK